MSSDRWWALACVMLVACGNGGGDGADATATADTGVEPDAGVEDNTTLSALTVNVGALVPPFQPEVLEYDLSVPLTDDVVAFTATAAVPASTAITVGGAAVTSGTPLETTVLPGTQELDVVVTAASGASTTYHVHVHRGTPAIALDYEGAAVSNPLAPAFDPATLTYGVEVGLWLQKVQLTVVPVIAGSTVTVAGGPVDAGAPSPPVSLNLGLTSIPVVVTAPGGAAATYAVNVTRGGQALQQAYAKASNTGPLDGFGGSIALWGDSLAIGAPFEASAATGINGDQADNSAAYAGAVYVFTRSGATWTQQAYLKASNTGAGDLFGASVALWGDTLVVGAAYEGSSATGVDGNQADNTAQAAGAAYVFTRAGTTWSQQAYLKASNTGWNDRFGWSVALWDDTLAVGAAFETSNATGVDGDQADDSADEAGAVYVFTRAGTIWSQQAYLKASNTDPIDSFGEQLALRGDTLAVGTKYESSAATGIDGHQDNDGARYAGAVYVFTRSGTTWSQQAYVKASNTGEDDFFGVSVALGEDTLAVGAGGEDSHSINDMHSNGMSNAGAVYVFTRSGTTWSQQAYLKGYPGQSFYFGNSVALWGDTLAVGATGEGGFEGTVYLFTRSGTTWWTPLSSLTWVRASNPGVEDYFGGKVALWGDTMVVGARWEDSSATGIGGDQRDNSASDAGAVYVFR